MLMSTKNEIKIEKKDVNFATYMNDDFLKNDIVENSFVIFHHIVSHDIQNFDIESNDTIEFYEKYASMIHDNDENVKLFLKFCQQNISDFVFAFEL